MVQTNTIWGGTPWYYGPYWRGAAVAPGAPTAPGYRPASPASTALSKTWKQTATTHCRTLRQTEPLARLSRSKCNGKIKVFTNPLTLQFAVDQLFRPSRMYRLSYLLLLPLFAINAPSKADWINLTGAETSPNIAEIYVLDDRVRVALEVLYQRSENVRGARPGFVAEGRRG